MRALQAGGADVVLSASNPLSTQDDVAASLVAHYEIPVYAIKGEDNATYYQHIKAALDSQAADHDGRRRRPGEHAAQGAHASLLDDIIGGTEETTTGVIRLRAMAKDGALKFPVIAVNDAHDQAPVRQPLRHRPEHARRHHPRHQRPAGRQERRGRPATAGAAAASPCAPRAWARNVIVTEVDPLKALEAVMDGFRVMPMAEAAAIGDIFITVTGDINVLDKHHFAAMKRRRDRWPTPATSTSRSTSRRWRSWPAASAPRARVRRRVHRWPTAAASTCWAKAA